MIIAMITAGLLGIISAIYLVFYSQGGIISRGLELLIHLAASIPSVIYGLLGYGILIVTLDIPKSLLTSGLTLGFMVYPYVTLQTVKVFETLPPQLVRDSLALGVSKEYTLRHLILPHSGRSLVATILPAGSFAVGATAPLLLTGVVMMAETPHSLLDPIMALPYHLNMLLSQTGEVRNAYGTALVLIIFLIIIHLISALLTQPLGRRFYEYFNHPRS